MKDALRKLSGLGHWLRPANVRTAEDFNAHIDLFATALKTFRIDEEPASVPQKREELGGSDRMERKGTKRKKKKELTTEELFGVPETDTSSESSEE